MLVNPFVLYILSLGAAAGAYMLGWSYIYPPLSPEMVLFLIASFAVAAALGLSVRNSIPRFQLVSPQLPDAMIWPLVLLFSIDLLYAGIPLKKLIEGTFEYAGDEIGVPYLHVFLVTFGMTFGVIRFADFLTTRRFHYLVEAILPIVFELALVYRGPAVVSIVSYGFVYLIARRPGPAAVAALGLAAIVGLYLFGVAGDFRQQSEQQILDLGKPSGEFERSGVPRAFFWTYTYLSAPLANLELAVDIKNLDERSAAQFVTSEFLPDFISKRLLPLLGPPERLDTPEVSRGINVATLFGRAAVYAGWPGVVAMFAWFCAVVLVYIRLIRDNPFAVPALALLNAIVLFCVFQNMIAHTGYILQIVWPLVLSAWLSPSERTLPRHRNYNE